MLLPFILLLLSTLSAAVVAYGTNSYWGAFHHGVAFIIEARRLQWPLVALSLVLCAVLLVLVIAGKRRAWWLIGLVPIVTLFAHRFIIRPDLQRRVIEDPPLVDAATARFLSPGDYIIGLHFNGRPIAFPYSQMDRDPAVLLRDRDQHLILMWSPGANKATAYTVGRELHARDLEVVSFPRDALLLYDDRLGIFINGITAQTTAHAKPITFREPISIEKLPWAQWVAQNPGTAVMAASPNGGASLAGYDPTARPPVLAGPTLTLVFAPTPLGLSPEDVGDAPVNLTAGTAPVLLLRDPSTHQLRAFDRRVEADLSPRFAAFHDPKHPAVVMLDSDTNTEWSANATAVTGPAETHGKSLAEIPVETELPAVVMQYWFPQMQQVTAQQIAGGIQPLPPAPGDAAAKPPAPTHHRRRHRASAS